MDLVDSVPRGLKGVVVTDTAIGDVRGEEGFFHYRQYSAIELAATRPFDDVFRLLVDGTLPRDEDERRRFVDDVVSGRAIPQPVLDSLPAVAVVPSPLDALR